MTAIGLAVAVPAVMGYNWLLRRNKDIIESCAISRPTCTYLVSGARVDAARRRDRAGGGPGLRRFASKPGRADPDLAV